MKRSILIYLLLAVSFATLGYAQIVIQPGGGSSFSAASPGAIGGTTSSTGQFTNVAVGASVPTLDGQTGDVTMSGGFATGGNAISGAAGNGDALISRASGGAGLLVLGGTYASADTQLTGLTNNLQLKVGSTAIESLTPTEVNIAVGATLQSAGGSIPTATCSGGSTGVSITAGSTNNRGQIVTSSSASTNCTITWSASGVWAQAPFCVVSDGAASITPTAVSVGATGTSTFVIDFASATSKTFNWVCM